MLDTTNGIATSKELEDFGRLVMEAACAWGGGRNSLVAAANNQRALNRLGHQIACDELGIHELTDPFYLVSSRDNIRTDLRCQNVQLPVFPEFDEWMYDEWSWQRKWKHLSMDTYCGHFTLIHFPNSTGLDLQGQYKALTNLGYQPARLAMAAPFVKRCGGGLGSYPYFPGVKEYTLLGSVLPDGNMAPRAAVLSQTIARKDWKRGPWKLSLRQINTLTRNLVLLVQAVDRYNLLCRLPGPI